MKVVFDTNVLISAYAYKGHVAKLRHLWEQAHLRLLFSNTTWDELVSAAKYPKLKWPVESRREVFETEIAKYSERGQVYEGPLTKACRDADDEAFLRLALGSNADALVSGDKDLLVLDGHYPFPILKPADFKTRFFYDFLAGENAGAMTLPKAKRPQAKKKKKSS